MTRWDYGEKMPCVHSWLVGCVLLSVGLVLSFHTSISPVRAATDITSTTGVGNLDTHILPPPSGNLYGITGGKPVGTNLFHSFGQFSVGTGDIAQFQTGTPLPNTSVHNILGRVTGNSPSAIFGTIDSATYYPTANFFLLNPNGIIFGPNATLSIGGTTHFTTADYLKLADRQLFKAMPDLAADALLSTYAVAAFGFLGLSPAGITVQGSQLTVANGTGLSLVGGNREFTYTNPDTDATATVPGGVTMTGGEISAPSGQINFASIGSPGEIAVETLTPGPNVDGVSPSSFGNISLSQNAQLNTKGTSDGTIHIRGGQFIMDSARILADSTVGTSDPTTAIAVNIEGDITLTNRSVIQSRALGPDRGGDIEISAKNVKLLDGSAVRTEGRSAGKAGDILVSATDKVVISGVDAFNNPSSIQSFTLGSGDSGLIRVTASKVTLADMGLIETATQGQQPAGDITLTVDRLDISGGGTVHTSGGDLAPSGSIHIVATDTISLSGIGQTNGLPSRIENENISGDTGTINIETNNLHMSNHGRINSLTTLAATELVEPKINIKVHNAMTVSEESRIDVNAFDSDVGVLAIQAGSLVLSGLSLINTETSGAGASGPINIATGALSVTGGSQIISASKGTGAGGNIFVNANSVAMTDGASITASSNDTGNAGNITINAASDFQNNGGIVHTTATQAQGGDIRITAGQDVRLSNGASVSASSTGPGNAGNITVLAGDDFQMQNSSITTQATQAAGGNIKIGAADQVVIQNSVISASVLGGAGGGGNIDIDPTVVAVQNSQILAQAVQGAGGNITITTPLFFADSTSLISASSQFGLNGTVTIQSPTSNLSGSVGSLPSSISQQQALQAQRCAALSGGASSSFLIAGRDTIPTEPGGWLTRPLGLHSLGGGLRADTTIDEQRPTTLAMAQTSDTMSLRRLTPAGFLTQRFAGNGSDGCRS